MINMVRKKRRDYFDEVLNKAIRLVADGKIFLKKASSDFNKLWQTENRLLNGKNCSQKGGRSTTLTHEKELCFNKMVQEEIL